MERLFKVHNLYRAEIEGRSQEEGRRPKLEVTLCYFETYYDSTNGTGIRRQFVQVALLDEAAVNCPLRIGGWIVASVSLAAFESKTTPGRTVTNGFLNRYSIVENISNL